MKRIIRNNKKRGTSDILKRKKPDTKECIPSESTEIRLCMDVIHEDEEQARLSSSGNRNQSCGSSERGGDKLLRGSKVMERRGSCG